MGIPVGIFEEVRVGLCCQRCTDKTDRASQDILPKEGGLKAKNYGQCAIRSDGVL